MEGFALKIMINMPEIVLSSEKKQFLSRTVREAKCLFAHFLVERSSKTILNQVGRKCIHLSKVFSALFCSNIISWQLPTIQYLLKRTA